jgi:hypothetical protein
MLVSEILKLLPNSVEWMVLFNLSTVGQITNHDTIRAMYHLPSDIPLDPYSHAVLTDQGHFLAALEGCKLVNADTLEILDRELCPHALSDRYAHRLKLVTPDDADCLGLAEMAPFSPVLLHLRLDGQVGKAQAIFDREPSFEHYELLQSVGVKFLAGEYREDYYLAYFQNRLPIHIHAGILSHFSRTAHCNVFFFRHGDIDAPLEAGLLSAAQARVRFLKDRCLKVLTQLADRACEESLSMTCQPPAPDVTFPYGDLVPLGFVLRALKAELLADTASEELIAAHDRLKHHVMQQQEDSLWAFHNQRLITATDSSLVLLGLVQARSVAELERFNDGQGCYYPQLWSETKQHGRMVIDSQCQHWCQPDYATTCVIRGLRQSAGLAESTSIDTLTAGFDTRSGLYFANPYLVDWVLAEALRSQAQPDATEPKTIALRDRLRSEVLNSMNPDFSFGCFDLAMSTALGILTLSALGVTDRTIRVAQLRLMELLTDIMQPSSKALPSIPFYSTLRIGEETPNEERIAMQLNEFFNRGPQHQKQVRTIAEQLHHISLYLDTHHMISTSLYALALSQPCDPTQRSHFQDWKTHQPMNSHSRYRCNDHAEYITQFALPPYLTPYSTQELSHESSHDRSCVAVG